MKRYDTHWKLTSIKILLLLWSHFNAKKMSYSSDSDNQKMSSANQPRCSVSAKVRYAVWRTHCGDFLDGQCFCCKKKISFEDWHCGHIIAHRNDGPITVENLRPICKQCNWSMGTRNMFDWMMYLQQCPMDIGWLIFNNQCALDAHTDWLTKVNNWGLTR